MQTSDPVNYMPLIEITSQTIREFVRRSGHSYQAFFGVRRGFHAWQATFNRIPMLADALANGYEGWVCYVDADAFIYDLDFPLSEYLADKDMFAFIGAPSGVTPPRLFQSITDQQLRAASQWDKDLPNDQTLLHDTLQNIEDAQAAVLVDDSAPRILNWGDGAFIRQIIRAEGSILERLHRLNKAVQNVLAASLNGQSADPAKDLYKEFIEALYRVLLMREPDEAGLKANWTRLSGGDTSLADEMRSCILSDEFQSKIDRFVERYRG
jgi:hypothetical protein